MKNNNMQKLKHYRSTLNRRRYSILAMLLLLGDVRAALLAREQARKIRHFIS